MLYNETAKEEVRHLDEGLISIIVPVYRTEAWLEKCVRSVLAQTDGNWELILVDDGSPDGSGALCDRLSEEDARIRTVHQENAGVSAARNRGLEEARGAFAVFLDSDDWVDADYLERLRTWQKESGAELVVCGYALEDGSGAPAAPSKPLGDKVLLPGDFLAGALKEENGIILSVCLGMFSMEAIGGLRFADQLAYGEDSLFLGLVLSRITKVWYDPVPLYHYLVSRDGNTYTELSLTKQESRIISLEAIRTVWTEDNKVRPLLEKILADLEIVAARLAYDAGIKPAFEVHRRAARMHARAVQSSPAISRKDKLRLTLAAASPIRGVNLYQKLKEGRRG